MKNNLRTFAGCVGLMMVFGLFQSSAALAQQALWGAVAYSPGAAGYASQWKHTSEANAMAAAMKACLAKNSGRCEVQTFSGDNCLGLIAGERGGAKYAAWTRNAGLQNTRTAAQGTCAKNGYTTCNIRTVVCANGKH